MPEASVGSAAPQAQPGPPMLAVEKLNAWYGESHILHGVDLAVRPGELVTILGRNGAGKTTTLRSLMGMVPRRAGSVKVQGTETINLPPHRIARLGMEICPEERGIFASLNVEENLLLPPHVAAGGMGVEAILTLFPNLRERMRSQGTKLSGGEQQMLAIARILRTGARLLLLDEPTAGMGHEDVDRISALIQRVAADRTVLMVEHNLKVVANLSHHITVLARGEVLAEGDYPTVSQNKDVVQAYMGADHA